MKLSRAQLGLNIAAGPILSTSLNKAKTAGQDHLIFPAPDAIQRLPFVTHRELDPEHTIGDARELQDSAASQAAAKRPNRTTAPITANRAYFIEFYFFFSCLEMLSILPSCRIGR